jgi:hypothetical protein
MFLPPAELLAKVATRGEIAIGRIEEFRDSTEIRIPMTSTIAML